MESTQTTVTIQEGGRIIIPDSVLEKVGLQVGDTLSLTSIEALIIAHKGGTPTNAVTLLEELGQALNVSGYNTKAKVQSLIDTVKMEVTAEWENATQNP